MDRQILNLMVDPIKHDLRISDVEMGLLQGFAFAAFYTMCGLPLGWAADKVNRRLLIFAGVIIWALATVACGLADTYRELLTARFVVGAGEAALLPAAYSILSDLFPRDRLTQAMSVFSVGAMIGTGAALGIGGLVVTYSMSGEAVSVLELGGTRPWQTVFILIGLPGIAMAFLVFLFPEPERKITTKSQVGDEKLLTFLVDHRAVLLRHFAGFSLICLVSYAAGAWAPTYLSRRFDLPMGEIGLGFGLASLIFGVTGFLASGWLVGKAFARGMLDAHFRYPAIGALMLAVTSTGAIFAPWPWLAILLFGANTLFTTVAAVSAAALQMITPPHLRGRTSSIFLVVFNLVGAGGGPLAVGLLTEHWVGTARLGTAMVTVFLIGSLLAASLLWNGRHHMRGQFSGAA
jgi:MFS family permease